MFHAELGSDPLADIIIGLISFAMDDSMGLGGRHKRIVCFEYLVLGVGHGQP